MSSCSFDTISSEGVSLSALRPGDIIVDTGHAGIYVGIDDKTGKPLVANALAGGYWGANYRCTSPNSFVEACHTLHPYVFRCKNQDLAIQAAYMAIEHSRKRDITYDEDRFENTISFDFSFLSFDNPVQEVAKAVHELFHFSGLFRAVKFLARRDMHLIQPPFLKEKKERGLRCAYATVLMYQMAALEGFVHPQDPTEGKWPSNKHADKREVVQLQEKIGEKTLERYMEFLRATPMKVAVEELRLVYSHRASYFFSCMPANRSFLRGKEGHVMAMEYWKGENIDELSEADFERLLTYAMKVDAKYVSAETLVEILYDDEESWELLGILEDLPARVSSKFKTQ